MLNFGSGGGFLDVPVKTGLIRNFDAATAAGLYRTANLRNGLGGVAFDGVDDVMTAADKFVDIPDHYWFLGKI